MKYILIKKKSVLKHALRIKGAVEMSIRLQDSMRAKERLQCDTSAMSFTSAVLLSDEDVRKNSKVGKWNDFSHFSGN